MRPTWAEIDLDAVKHNFMLTKELVGERVAVLSVVKAGGKLVKPAEKAFWGGYSGYFADPDGNLWEVAYNPVAPLGPKGEFQWNGF